MTLKGTFAGLFRLFKEPHSWKEDPATLTRTCTVCGEEDEFEQGDGFTGPMWHRVKRGRPDAH